MKKTILRAESSRDRSGLIVSALMCLGFLACADQAAAGVVPASDCSHGAITAAVAAATAGDVVVIPAGSCTWTTSLIVNKAITVTGLTCTVDQQGRATSCPTVITNNVVNGGSAVLVTLVANQITRITNLEFATGTGTGQFVGIVGANTDNRRFRVDHVKMTVESPTFAGLQFYQAYGVVDHSTINFNRPAGVGHIKGHISADWGDENWARGPDWGTDRFVFFENCTLNQTGPNSHLTMLDAHFGGRYVVRYSTLNRGNLDGHGTEGARERAHMAAEVYHNAFTLSSGTHIGYWRGGSHTVYDNAIYAPTGLVSMNLLNPRILDPFSFGMADGHSPWDVNDPANPFATGSVTSASSLALNASSASWTPDQWIGYSIRKTGGSSVKTCSSLMRAGVNVTATCPSHGFSTGNRVGIYGAALNLPNYTSYAETYTITVADANTFTFTLKNGAGTPPNVTGGQILATIGVWSSEVSGNGATSLTFRGSLYGYHLTFAAGDTFEINRVEHSIDQIGRTGGSPISGPGPIPPGAWNDQVTVGDYEWNNVRCPGSPATFNCAGGDTSAVSFRANHRQIRENVHYFNDTARPGYIPYAYPHPLTLSGSEATPSTPRNLRIVPEP